MDWEQLKAQCVACRSCDLCTTRNNVVFEAGNREAKLMFVGEGPGEQEDRRGIPFVGAAGQFLDEMLSIIDVDRKRCYIANIVKCRPPQNRDPLETEQDACWKRKSSWYSRKSSSAWAVSPPRGSSGPIIALPGTTAAGSSRTESG